MDIRHPQNDNDDRPLDPSSYAELQLHRYLEGRLSGKDREAVEETLRTQPTVRRMLDAMREEERLIRESMEARVETGTRLCDKVIATLHSEERFRLQAQRNRRLRRQVFAAVSMAACLFLVFWLAKPRESAGTAVSGSSGTVITLAGEHRVLNKSTRVYEGDQLTLGEGQFVRMRLSSSATVDIDEHTRISFEKPRYDHNDNAQVLNMESGRIGVDAAGRQDVLVQVPQGTLRVLSGSRADIWLVEPSNAKWPDMIEAFPASGSATESAPRERPAVATVFTGTVLAGNEVLPTGAAVDGGYRVVLFKQSRAIRKVDMESSVTLDMRTAAGWHGVETVAPGMNLLGLLQTPDFNELGRRFHMAESAPEVGVALNQMQSAMQIANGAQRAEILATSQEALRNAYEPFKSSDERRRSGRMLEGLAHYQRGRALLSTSFAWSEHGTDERQSAFVAFKAACVAFEEALDPAFTGEMPSIEKAAKKNTWAVALSHNGVSMADLSPSEQTNLMASFMHAVALRWQAGIEPKLAQAGRHEGEEVAIQAAREFAELRADLGRSVESLAVRYAEGLGLKQGRQYVKAVDAFRDVLSMQLAGCTPLTRQYADGIKQASILALVQSHLAAKKPDEAKKDAEEFWLLYPLDAYTSSPVDQQIEHELEGNLINGAEKAVKEKKFDSALELLDELFENPAAANSKSMLDARLMRVKVLLALSKTARAQREIADMAPMITPGRVNEFKALAAEAASQDNAPATASAYKK